MVWFWLLSWRHHTTVHAAAAAAVRVYAVLRSHQPPTIADIIMTLFVRCAYASVLKSPTARANALDGARQRLCDLLRLVVGGVGAVGGCCVVVACEIACGSGIWFGDLFDVNCVDALQLRAPLSTSSGHNGSALGRAALGPGTTAAK